MIWSVFERVSQSNSRFNALDKLVLTVHSVKMPIGLGRCAMNSRGRPFSVMAHLKRSIVEVKAEENCLAHAPIITIARVDNDPNYKAYRQGRKVRPLASSRLSTSGGIRCHTEVLVKVHHSHGRVGLHADGVSTKDTRFYVLRVGGGETDHQVRKW